MTAPPTYTIGRVRATRVPYFDIALDPEVIGLTPEAIAGAGAASVGWVDETSRPVVGQAVWIVESGGRMLVVDPCGAADDFIRSGPEAITHQEAVLGAIAGAGFPPERVDTVVLSHLDGIGMAAVVDDGGRWAPAFPNARIVFTADELAFLTTPAADEVSGVTALRELLDNGVVDAVEGDHRFTDEVRFDQTGAHSPGHALVHIESEGERATFIGHLALSPLHLVTGDCPLNDDPPTARTVLRGLVDDAAAAGALLIGPLWPEPGACRIDRAGAPVPA